MAYSPEKPTLIDAPLSPLGAFGARVRYIVYSQGLEESIDIKGPSELGGMKSEEYLKMHLAGKIPLLVLPSGQGIPESAVRPHGNRQIARRLPQAWFPFQGVPTLSEG